MKKYVVTFINGLKLFLNKRLSPYSDDVPKDWHPCYIKWEPIARSLKIHLQMIIGFTLVVLLVSKFVYHLCQFQYPAWLDYLKFIHSISTLEIISRALAYSAGIELAYMLFTPGPDEAIEPLITGASAALLYGISKSSELNISVVASILIYVFVIAGLFMLKEVFIAERISDKTQESKKQRVIDIIFRKRS